MKERPILFNTEMVKAILDGRKTQTRRPVKNQPSNGWAFDGVLGCITSPHPKKGKFGAFIRKGIGTEFPQANIEVSPFGMPGDHLWVRETFAPGLCTESTIAYRATHKPSDLEEGWFETIQWTPSIHMPRWACRLVLEITNVRLERIQDITEEDALAEGISYEQIPNNPKDKTRARTWFRGTWDSLYKNWSENPWVWVIEFKIAELNGKKMEQAA